MRLNLLTLGGAADGLVLNLLWRIKPEVLGFFQFQKVRVELL